MESAVDLIVKKYKQKPWALVSILQDTQDNIGYLPEDLLRQVAKKMEIPLPQIYGVATFFKSLNLTPQGKHQITCCLGTACHVRGAPRVVDEITNLLKVEPGETTKDGEYTLKVVNCVGACAIGPVVIRDDKYYGKMSASKVKNLLVKHRRMNHEKGEKSI
ncbi:NAD(P)H-dependent oxidoreductase subunit E [Candidatus Aerophobetes bacterium]|uniref:NAD(P)H-dependent oxidoreductase subunit E n=1 Tax=Aerophobetes bacterium TaxID=2030807 RepID=A0A523UKN7_UNCAE|nr:MAG: NAD(P)H-dependent oxidoreductase subunit E [Candidatus Aerophobetes bacterium]